MVAAKNKSETEMAFENLSKLEIPASVRDFAEKGAAQAKDTYTKIKAVTDEASDAFEGAYTTASKGASTLGLKVLESARTNANASFDHAIALFGVKTLSDIIELNTSFLRKQSETVTVQVKEFGELAQKVANETIAPVKAQVEKSFRPAI
ncbi:phasin [Labrys monachus]|uniref:Phasin n=1 Tax=Labrys monachus TaxID=217067 RepID=A0ABU0FDL4_9HYPH|nr:phasin [Labrys monachus]MDQ0392698.1 phasin [Labrys monachus]